MMRSTIKIRSQQLDDYTEIKVLISHVMENGRNRDPVSGELIPAHFIQELIIEQNGINLISANLGGSMSKNPFFSFRLKDCRSGDRLSVHWTDNLGQGDSAEHTLE
jgi:sulfur-oxidizing protein SoxZ